MSLGQKTITGILWQAAQVLANRAANVICRLVLAYIVAPADFGIVAQAIAVLAVAGVVSDFGAGRVLIRRKASFHLWVGPAAVFTFASSIAIMGLLVVASPFLAKDWFRAPEVGPMIIVLALDLPLRALMLPARTALQADMRFRDISRIQIIQGVFMVALSITLAACGQGAWSMIYPVPLSSLLGVILFWRIRKIAFWENPRLDRIRHLMADSVGMACYNIAAQFIYFGDNLMIGRFAGKESLGQYAMAYTLAVQMVNLVSSSLSSVLFPALASIKHDKEQLRAAWLKAMRLVALVAFPACLIQIPLADPVIRLVLPPKWEPAIPIVQALSFGVAVRAAGVLVEPLMFAAGRLRLMIVIGVIQAVGVMLAATLGAACFNASEAGFAAACGVAGAYTLLYALAIALCAREIGLPWWRPLVILARPFGSAVVAVGGAWALSLLPWPVWKVTLFSWEGGRIVRDLALVLKALLMLAAAVGIYFVLARQFMRDDMDTLLRRVRGMRKSAKTAEVGAVAAAPEKAGV